MKKTRTAILIAILLISGAESLTARTTVSFEWGYTSTLYQFCNYTFHTEEGMIMNDKFNEFDYRSNGLFTAGIGFGSSRCITSIHAGLAGIQDSRRVVPVTVRETLYPKGIENDGIFALLDAGAAFTETLSGKPIFIGKVGAGRHKAVNDRVGIDIGIFLKMAADNPVKYFDSTNNKFLYKEDISSSSRNILGIDFTISINF